MTPELALFAAFAEQLYALAAPEAKLVRQAFGTGTSGARITLAEARVFWSRREEHLNGQDVQKLMQILAKKTKERWVERERRGADERAKSAEKQAAKKGARAR
ncbi:MAG: hypothetical protein Q8Q14_09990 [Gemmatimonadales bacterium]|nr:hypothetical protein [Gemmatimonadales bacterium]